MKQTTVILLALMFSVLLSGCNTTPVEDTPEYKALLQKVGVLEVMLEEQHERFQDLELLHNSELNAAKSESADGLRVFYNGNSDVWLYPDGRFIMNYFHNTKITGTYSEIPDPRGGDESALMFTHNGKSHFNNEDGASFEWSGEIPVTVVGGIANGILTIPEDWEDDHGHGNKYKLREKLVFAAENGNKITLNVDRSFTAEFSYGIKIMGYYAARAYAVENETPYVYNNVIFIPGAPGFSSSGELLGAVFVAPVTDGTSLLLPEEWAAVAGEWIFELQ